MSEFFIELFSEEIPADLQSLARENIVTGFKNFFEKEDIVCKGIIKSYSTPNRLVVYFQNITLEVLKKSEEIRGPSIVAPKEALEGFIKSNQIEKKNVFKKKTDKGEFYFFSKPEKKIKTRDLLNQNIHTVLDKIPWKKSMKWGEFNLYWGRPLKSILAILDGKPLNFKFHHLNCSNTTFVDKEFEEKKKLFKNFKSYIAYFKKNNVIIDNDIRKNFIKKSLIKIANKKNLKININNKLLTEVNGIVEKPKIITCTFDKRFLEVPKEILIITMQQHQKYFPTFDNNENLTNNFFIVVDNKDQKGLIKIGNERVIEARVSDAKFFWEKNKTQSLVKQVGKLKNLSFFNNLGSFYNKTQRLKKLAGLISDQLNLNKEKVEISSSICKSDLVSDLVGEYPELQGTMGKYFAISQGFDEDVCAAISDHYLPIGIGSEVPKKPISSAVAAIDKIDTLVGFFGINEKPTSSKDPFALRRSALGVIRLLLENNKEFKLKDLINYSYNLYLEQGFEMTNKTIYKDLNNFFVERLKNYMKEKNIRSDIIESAISSYGIDNILKIYKKSTILNKLINKNVGDDLLFSYKRASNILNDELKDKKIELSNSADPVLFKTDYENYLYQKIQNLRKYFSNIDKEESYEKTLNNLASSKKEVSDFFDNVIVNDKDISIKKNRLELLYMLCKTFDNYLNFSKIESV